MFYIIFIIFIISIYFSIKNYLSTKNSMEKHEGDKSIIKEMKSLFNDFIKNNRFRMALLTFMLWELSFYSVFVLDVDMGVDTFKYLSISMIFGYFMGVLYLKFSYTDDIKMIKSGYIISFISFAFIFVFNQLINDITFVTIIFYCIYGIGSALLVPSLFSLVSKERRPEEQGKICGLIDSADAIAFLLATIVAMMYRLLQLSPIYMILFSFVIFVISLFTYMNFKKMKISQ